MAYGLKASSCDPLRLRIPFDSCHVLYLVIGALFCSHYIFWVIVFSILHVYFRICLSAILYVQKGKTISRFCDEILKWRSQWLGDTNVVKERKTNVRGLRMFWKKAKRMQSTGSHPDDLTPSPVTLTSYTTSSGETYPVKKCPVVSYSQFEYHVKQINPMAKTDFIQLACNYLQDMGEVRISE